MYCFFCQKSLTQPGGIMFSPPAKDDIMLVWDVKKLHVCISCWPKILELAPIQESPAVKLISDYLDELDELEQQPVGHPHG